MSGMRRGRIMALWIAMVGTFAAVAGAEDPAAPRFRYERTVNAPSGRAHRLDVDVTLLAGSQPFTVTDRGDHRMATGGLGDLRLYDASGTEAPYLIVSPPTAEPEWQTAARVLPLAQTKETSGFEADLSEPIAIDALRVHGIRAPFLKRLVLEGSGDRERWTMLAEEGTLFDLPDEGLEQTALTFTPGPYRYLRVTWDDTHSGRVDPPAAVAVRLTSHPVTPPRVLRVPLVVERRQSEPGISRFRVQLPAANLPIVELDLGVGGGHVLREARVSEPRLRGDQARYHTIGAATLRRVVREGVAAEALRISISPPREAQLELVVEDGDNPPLDLRSVTAVFAELPWIYFEHEPGTLVARYGNPKLQAPRYDLEAARPDVTARQTTEARWGEAHALASDGEQDEGSPMPETGARLQAGSFRYLRAIPSGSGLVTVPLDAAVLAHSGALATHFGDVRVLDESGRQVPYLLEHRDEPLAIDVRLEQRDLPAPVSESFQGRTAYFVELPYQRLPQARIVIQTRARVFRRPVTLGVLLPPAERRRQWLLEPLSSTVWQHTSQDVPARGLVMDVPATRRGDIVVVVDEGDNRPLPIEKATLLLPSYAIRFYRLPDVPLSLAYGHDDLRAPRYDLALLAPRVLGSVAQEVYPDREVPARTSNGAASLVSPPVFWASLGLAVLVLLGLIVRLVRREDEEAARGPGEASG